MDISSETIDEGTSRDGQEPEQEIDNNAAERELESTPTEDCQEDSSVYFTPQHTEHDSTLDV